MLVPMISKVLLALGMIALPMAALAANDHAHGHGPHGGEVKSLGAKFHLEAAKNGDKIQLFLLDGDGKTSATLTDHEGVTVTTVAPNSPPGKTQLAAGSAFSNLELKAPPQGKVTVLVSIKLKGDAAPTSASFVFAESHPRENH